MKHYCRSIREDGYGECVVPTMSAPIKGFYDLSDSEEYIRYDNAMREYIKHLSSLPVAALVVGGKTGWLEGYEVDIESHEGCRLGDKCTCNNLIYVGCPNSIKKLEKKPEEKSEGEDRKYNNIMFPIAVKEIKVGESWVYVNEEYNISGYGKTKKDAQDMFRDCVHDALVFVPTVVEDRPKWVKASERLPEDTKKDRPLYIRKTDSYYIGWLSLTRDIWVTINDDFNKNEDIEWLEEP